MKPEVTRDPFGRYIVTTTTVVKRVTILEEDEARAVAREVCSSVLAIDRIANAAYIPLSNKAVKRTVGADANIDYDKDGNVRGIEIIGVEQHREPITDLRSTLTPKEPSIESEA